MQQILNGYRSVLNALDAVGSKRCMLVCDSAYQFLPVKECLTPFVTFDQFTPNPLYEQVCKGVELFNANRCDALVAVGGGSTIDVAKCIKLYCRMDSSLNYLQQECFDSKVPLIAVPTTAGTGSESTRYAVIYFDGKKQSVAHASIVPDFAVLDSLLLKSLPLYQKKCTMMDALCQGIESWWSVNSTEESMAHSRQAVKMIVENWKGYIFDDSELSTDAILKAANLAGQAINITQTTAPHAMSYKLTSMYALPHGHAVAVCLPGVWRYMAEHTELCVDARGADHLNAVLKEIGMLCCGSSMFSEGVAFFYRLLDELGLALPHSQSRQDDLLVLTASVNPFRLRNNPVSLDEKTIYSIYNNILQ